MILTRAKMVPLHLEARVQSGHWNHARFSSFQEELQRRISRTCHLVISAKTSYLRKTLGGLVSPAPALESLSLSSEENWPRIAVPETLFGGTMPRLSFLELDTCGISWNSSLLKGLRSLDIRSPPANTRPSLSVWLGALSEMSQLKTLTLHSASPIAPPFPFDVERTVAIPSLTHLDISSSAKNCALALAHLELPALTWLCLTAILHFPYSEDVQEILPYVARHAHGPQDTQPLQSALIRNKGKRIDILAWPVPDIDVEVHGRPTLLTANLPTRLSLSFIGKDWYDCGARSSTRGMAMVGLPLDDLVTLIAQDFTTSVWLHDLPKWPLLRRVRLVPFSERGFIHTMLEDNGGCDNPLLPSLKELALVDIRLYKHRMTDLYNALMMRVEQGVPLELLDLRTCHPDPENPGAVRLLSEIVVNVLGPEETLDARAQIRSMWDHLGRGPFVEDDNSGEANQLDTENSDASSDDDDDDDEE